MKCTLLIFPAVILLALLSNGCAPSVDFDVGYKQAAAASNTPAAVAENVFDGYMQSDSAPADGFDFPIGDADAKGIYTDGASGKQYKDWYIATKFAEEYSLGIHPGEDWNGGGGGDTDLGQSVYAVANGRVVFAADCGRLWGNVVIVEHTFYENFEKRKIRSLYAHLQEIKVQKGEAVKRRQLIATVGQDPEKLFDAHLHLEFRWDETLPPTYWASSDGKNQDWVKEHYAPPSEFIKNHRKLPVPQQEANLVLIDQESYKMRLYRNGQSLGEYEISLGQGSGQKQIQGDNKTPKGMYFVIQKHRGKFPGSFGEYFGGHWIKVNYPNKYDAARGKADGLISARQAAEISSKWEKRLPTLQNTKLGGGIGFHGWNKEWSDDGARHLSWGCVVMHIYDIKKLFDRIPENSMVVIF